MDIIEDAQRLLKAYGDMPVDELIRTLLEEAGIEMKKRYKIVLNVEIADPEKSFPAGGDFTHSTRIEGVVKLLTGFVSWPDGVTVSLDKVIDKGEIDTPKGKDRR